MRFFKAKFLVCVLSGMVISSVVSGADFKGVQALAQRRVPWLSKALVFKKTAALTEEQFTLTSDNNKLVISATTASAAAFGLNWYLKYYCHRSMSRMGDNLSPVYPLPKLDKPVTVSSFAQYRYALNYCTYNYTTSFYTWKDWEHELDWMALNGVNTMLVANGAEAVWQHVLKALNYSANAIDSFITGPAYNAWWLMGNIQAWGGPMAQSQIDNRAQLVQKMLRRMKSMGIEPVMPAFFGMVPADLKHKVKAHIITQGTWGFFTRPDILDPTDALFDKMADLFYAETKRLYGNDIHLFSGDPFHEGGTSDGVNLAKAGLAVQKAMQRNFPGAVWVLQGWQANPRKEMLAEIDRSGILIQELFGENTQNWEDRKGYEGTPFIWCTVTNFGERPGVNGKLQRFADEVYRARKSAYGQYLKGVGIMPEGINNNPVVYELMMELAWHAEHVDVKQWIRDYATARYGKTNESVNAAWQLLLQTAYSSELGYAEGPPENILCARPALQIKSVSSWGSAKKKFDVAKYKEAVKLFAKALPGFEHSATYKLDLVNFVKQDIADDADTVFSRLVKAYEQKDATSFEEQSRIFLGLIDRTEELLNTNAYFSFNTYLQQAAIAATGNEERKNNLLNALMLVTFWGGDDPKEDNLHDYAYKEWGGLMSKYYKKRWQLYFEQLRNQLNGQQFAPIDFFHWERKWVQEQHTAVIGNIAVPKENSLARVIAAIYK
ncbi:alpha-N-acetylglucosaminidase [Danxiaibacter flavus]|uniref:Alpha-N-acetylglucosaminidase n=1 Tax=Danxiaibacter flavus TaxID=3049108 RepID=A0ABV3ZQ90_9BACT|nr:alpha-N-acetylglucosaminidase [Chitinophagaceae bacterium DXS]